jgi:hypothetical protein
MSRRRPVDPNSPVVRNPDWAKQVFEAAQRPVAWLYTARKLRQSARTILEAETPVSDRHFAELRRVGQLASEAKQEAVEFDEKSFPPGNFDAAYLLIALSIENLLKGIMVAKEMVTFPEGELPKSLKDHELHNLHRTAQPKAMIADHILDSLTYMSIWRARYPIPVAIDGFWPIRDGVPKGAGFAIPDSHTEFLRYSVELEVELVELIEGPAKPSEY